jgi:hypothetical protein
VQQKLKEFGRLSNSKLKRKQTKPNAESTGTSLTFISSKLFNSFMILCLAVAGFPTADCGTSSRVDNKSNSLHHWQENGYRM